MILTDNGKILISPDGKVYSGGSSGGDVAKLVARGTYDAEGFCFKLDNPLEQKKLYYVFVYSGWGYEYSTILLVTENNCETPFICRDADDSNNIICSIYYSQYTEGSLYMIAITPLVDEVSTIFGTSGDENDYIEVYELPFTIGGNE